MSLDRLTADFVDAWFRLNPHLASERGYRKYDRRAPSFGAEDLDAFGAVVDRTRAALDGARGVEADLLRTQLEAAPFEFTTLDRATVDPLLYVAAALDGLEALELRAAAGDEAAEAALPDRLAAIPPLLAQAAERVRAPVDAFADVADEMLEAGAEHLTEGFDGRLRELAEDARAAFDTYREALAKAERRPFEAMGPAAYGRLLEHEHCLDPDPTPWLELAHATLAEVDAALAAQPDVITPAPPPDFGHREVLAHYRHELAHVRRFVEERGLVTIPDGRLEMRETPPYLRALIPGASYLPPPAFSRGRTGHLYLRPVPRAMDAEQRAWWHGRVAQRSFRNLVAHECWPGHHVQFLHANRHPSPLRRYRDNDVMVEGWGLYSEQLVDEAGLWADAPAPRPLQALRFRALRVLVDVGLHTGTTSLEGAADLMCRHLGEGARGWVSAEVRRYAAEPTQAMSYLVGRQLILDLRAELRDHRGADYDQRAFHDAFLAEGSIPVPLIRRALLDDGV